MCTPTGLECYKTISMDTKTCLGKCEGLYADVDEAYFQNNDQIENVGQLVSRYEEYKRGYHEDVRKYLGQASIQ